MNHDRLWAPWRLAYVRGAAQENKTVPVPPGADPACFLCRAAADTADRENLLVHRGPRTVVVLNRFPYNNGHLLVSPREHLAALGDLSPDHHLEAMSLLGRLTRWFGQHMQAEGFNVGLNLGRVAGAGLPGHLHWHLVPRWNGDTNFMPALAGARVIPQSLDAMWEFITSTWEEV